MEHEHSWLITDIWALVHQTEEGGRQPAELRAELRCASCTAALYELTMRQLKDEIAADRVRGDSLAQWASIMPLFC